MDRDLSKNNATLSSTHCWVIMKRLIYKELGIPCAVAVTVEEHSAYSKGKPCVITLSAHSKAHFFETLRRKKYEQSEQLFPCQRLFFQKEKKERELAVWQHLLPLPVWQGFPIIERRMETAPQKSQNALKMRKQHTQTTCLATKGNPINILYKVDKVVDLIWFLCYLFSSYM